MTAPLLLGALALYGAAQGVDLFDALTHGARKGLLLLWEMLPTLLILFAVLDLFRASGLPELLSRLLSPVLEALGIPRETGLLMLLRPLSGSAALSAASELIDAVGPDSLTGRTAAVMLGSSETTFYVIALYSGAAGGRPSPWTVPAALCADLVCFLSSAWICRLLWG